MTGEETRMIARVLRFSTGCRAVTRRSVQVISENLAVAFLTENRRFNTTHFMDQVLGRITDETEKEQ